jgi:membrane-bound serine protease (ClpP class)
MTNGFQARRLNRMRIAIAAFVFLFGLLMVACKEGPNAAPGSVEVLTTDGEVNVVMDRYIDRGISAAEDDHAAAVVIRLDTPGGLMSSMDNIVQRILEAKVPVIVYVWPSGGRAASAGTFITYAGHVASMAPTTNIGAATPIDSSGNNLDSDLRTKAINDAVAKITGLAELRGRDAEFAEQAVRDGASITSSEALERNVVDYVEPDLPTLLQKIDGTSVELQSGEQVRFVTANAPVAYNDMNWIENILDVIANPNITFLLLSLGGLALFIELFHPGAIIPATVGVVCLVLAFFSLTVIPFNWAGLVLIAFAFLLFGLEVFTYHGLAGALGAVCLVLGGLILFSGNPGDFQPDTWLIFVIAAPIALMFIFGFANMLRVRRMAPKMGKETIVGRVAVARSPLTPKGFVFMDGATWTAEAEEGQIEKGDKVIVTEIRGLRLKVRRQSPEGAHT